MINYYFLSKIVAFVEHGIKVVTQMYSESSFRIFLESN